MFNPFASNTQENYTDLKDLFKETNKSEEKNVYLKDYVREWVEEKRMNVKPATIRVYKNRVYNHILPYFGNIRLAEITRKGILDLQKKIATNVSANTANEVLKTIKALLRDAKRDELVEKDVSVGILPVKERRELRARESYHRALSVEEQKYFIQELKNDYYYPFIALMLQTGMRQGEVSALTADDLDFKNKVIHVHRTMTFGEDNRIAPGDSPKTYTSNRDIPMNKAIQKILSKVDCNVDGPIFKSITGKYVTNSVVNRSIKRTLERLELKGISIPTITSHALRDTFATRYAEQHRDEGGDLETLKELLGHANLTMTADLYVHVLDDTKHQGMAKLNIRT